MTNTYTATVDTSEITELDAVLGNIKAVLVSVDHKNMTAEYKLVVV